MRAGKLSALFLTTAIALTGLAGKAHALDAGDHKSFAQMEQTLRQEHQVEIARGLFILNPEDPARAKELCLKFTINAQGEAYILLSDNMDDSKAHTELVYAKLKNARAYDPQNVGVMPDDVSSGSNLAHYIKQAAGYGDGVLLHGQNVRRLPDGSEATTGSVTATINMSDNPDRVVRDRIIMFITASNGIVNVSPVIAKLEQYEGLGRGQSRPDMQPRRP